MRVHAGLQVLLAIGVGCLGLARSAVTAQTKPETRPKYETLIYSVKGPDLFRANCAACHGPDGKGDGPAALSLRTKPANLTLLAKRSGGRFPSERVRKIISGDEPSLLSHGSREMPVWGPIFHKIEDDQDLGNVRVQNLTKYLETIQQK
jgi:mono/diheme cytochrome c family protein